MLQFPSHIDRISQLMQYAEMNHRVISHNLANVNTPGYQRLKLDFSTEIQNANSAAQSQLKIVPDLQRPSRMDGNNVDIDRELGQLNRNSLLFETYSQILTSHLSMMRLALGRS